MRKTTTRGVLAGVAVLGLLAGPSGAIEPADAVANRGRRPVTTAVADRPGAAWHALPAAMAAGEADPQVVHRSLVSYAALGAGLDETRAFAAEEGSEVVLSVVGDLDGDGGEDVVATAFDEASEEVTFTGRDGRTGNVLWSRDLAGELGFLLRLDEAGGPAGAVLLVTFGGEESDTGGTFTLTLAAVDADGTPLWTDERSGAFTFSPAGEALLDVPLFGGLIERSDGFGVLVGAIDRVSGPFGPEPAWTRAIVLDGETGAERTVAERQTGDRIGFPTPAPDLTGDGHGDIVFLLLGEDEDIDVAAHDGRDGDELWVRGELGLAPLFGLLDVSDTSGDGVPDLAAGDPFWFGFGEPPPTFLLSGADGAVLWRKHGGAPVALGDVDGDGRADVGLLSSDSDEFGVRWAAFTGAGAAIYERRHRLGSEAVSDIGFLFGTSLRTDAGDLDADGVPDVVAALETERGPSAGLALSGRTGDALWRRAAGTPTGAGAGRGDDLLLVDVPAPGGVALRSQQGVDGDLRWQRLLHPGEGELLFASVEAAERRDGHDLVASVFIGDLGDGGFDEGFDDGPGGPDEEELFVPFELRTCAVVLDSADGRVRWSAPSGCHQAASPFGDEAVRRLGGSDRTETAAAISGFAFPHARTVLLTRSDDYADALTGTPLARSLGAPLLFTGTDELPDATLAELERLEAEHVVVLGGDAAVGEQVVRSLRRLGLSVERVFGPDRFATGAEIALRLGPDAPAAFIAEGINTDRARGWPDTLSAAPLGGALARPVLLTTRDSLPQATSDALRALGTTSTTVVGGEAAVGAAVVDALRAAGHNPTRLAGATRYETNRAVHRAAVAAGADAGAAWVGTGLNWPDALTGGASVAARGGALVLVDGLDLDRSPPTRDLLAAGVDRALLLGGDEVIAESTARRIASFVR